MVKCLPSSACGRGITCTDTSSPTAVAVSAPASVAAFTALRLPEQARRFGQAALNLGAARTEVIEAIVQTAPYSGFPPALNALSALSDVLR